MEQQQLIPADVRTTVSRHAHVFCLQGEQVNLWPQLDICAGHCGLQGCQDCHTCTNLHICPNEVMDKCDAGQNCVLGHHWFTDHNLAVLRPLFLHFLSAQALCKLLQLLYTNQSGQHQDQGPLAVYLTCNEGRCNQVDCQRSHDPVSLPFCRLPDQCKLSTKLPQEKGECAVINIASCSRKVSERSQNVMTDNGSNPAEAQHKTLWSHYLQGNVPTPEICYHSVEGSCSLEGSGCPRLHASQHFHWQVRQQTSQWMNLRPSQVTCLERAFCDPRQNGTDLPRLDPETLDMSLTGLLALLGRNIWHADFPNIGNFTHFTLINFSKTQILELRRLCTEIWPRQAPVPATNAWYFLDQSKNWVKYGMVDSMGNIDMWGSVTSCDIENHFKQNPFLAFSFMNHRFTYILDLQMMIQTNQKTRTSRAIRRRPELHLLDMQKQEPVQAELPSHWEGMQVWERVRRVTLDPMSSEYQTVVKLLEGKISSLELVKVERIQNPYLWRALQNKINELSAVYLDTNKVNIRLLFHGTTHYVFSNICAENLDWRLHGSSTGQLYGRGTYFSVDPAYSYKYCIPDPNGFKYMFVAIVAVGSITNGNSSMVRPPINPATSFPYDSTVDSVFSPNIIVKYDKQEYYPEYLFTFNSFNRYTKV